MENGPLISLLKTKLEQQKLPYSPGLMNWNYIQLQFQLHFKVLKGLSLICLRPTVHSLILRQPFSRRARTQWEETGFGCIRVCGSCSFRGLQSLPGSSTPSAACSGPNVWSHTGFLLQGLWRSGMKLWAHSLSYFPSVETFVSLYQSFWLSIRPWLIMWFHEVLSGPSREPPHLPPQVESLPSLAYHPNLCPPRTSQLAVCAPVSVAEVKIMRWGRIFSHWHKPISWHWIGTLKNCLIKYSWFKILLLLNVESPQNRENIISPKNRLLIMEPLVPQDTIKCN